MSSKDASYKKSILKELYLGKTLSAADLCARIGKSLTLTMKTLNEMIKEGLVVEKGLAPSNGGRRPLIYSLKPDAFYLIAVAMDQLVSKIAVIDAQSNFVGKIFEFELTLVGNDEALPKLTEYIDSVIANSKIDKHKFIGIGIGMPGFVDAKKGDNYTYLGKNINDYIKSKTGLPVFIENDSSIIALAEYVFGAAKEQSHAMIVNISWEIGLGMIINDKLFRGNNGFAGEFGHIPLFSNGKLCGCGKIGCLETETSLSYMFETIAEQIKSGKDSLLKKRLAKAKTHEQKYEQFIDAAKIGDLLVVETISDAGYKLGRGIATLIHILNPGKVILTGRCAAAGKMWLAPVQRAINEFCIPRLVENIEVEMSTLNQTAEVVGAAILVMDNINHLSIDNIQSLKTAKNK